jgi:hypothetical protein
MSAKVGTAGGGHGIDEDSYGQSIQQNTLIDRKNSAELAIGLTSEAFTFINQLDSAKKIAAPSIADMAVS